MISLLSLLFLLMFDCGFSTLIERGAVAGSSINTININIGYIEIQADVSRYDCFIVPAR